MPDIDKIIEQLLGDRRMSESAAFSMRSYSDQPLIEKGSDLKARMEQRAQERAERHKREARERRERAGAAEASQRYAWRRSTNATQNQNQPKSNSVYEDLLQQIAEQQQALRTSYGKPPEYGTPTLEELPERIKEMRELEGAGVPRTLAYGSSSAAALFYRQARLMEDYEDDYAFIGSFMQYYPTYASMTNGQLRGYFTWRSDVRLGRVEAAPLSFAFVYVYELLMGVGTTPGRQGLADLRAFGRAYRQADELQGMRLNNYLRDWLEDYAVYHNIPEAYQYQANAEQDSAALTLIKAEHAYLQHHKRSPKIPHPAIESDDAKEASSPTDEQIFQALGDASSYHICTSRLAKTEPDLLRAVALDVFYALVMHCSKRRKTDYVEGLFGYASRYPYTMYSAAVFYEEEPHPDCMVRVSDAEAFECKDGQWWHIRACETVSRSSELGLALHAADFELREQLGYPYPLKRRNAPKYLWKIVHDTVTEHLERRAEAERRRITIDLSKLGEIRAAAAVTQEALLTDEERGEIPVAAVEMPPRDSSFVSFDNGSDSAEHQEDTSLGSSSPASLSGSIREQVQASSDLVPIQPHRSNTSPAPSAGQSADDERSTSDVYARYESPADTVQASSPHGASVQPPQTEPTGLLTPEEAHFLTGLLEGLPASELLGARAQFVSVVVDSINEKLFDEIGDAVIEFDGDTPCLVEDYLEDVREVLHA